jgi:Na+-driven multidrug efflux pump
MDATRLMLGGPVLPTLLRLAAPNVLGLFAATVVIGFDGYIVGRLGADALATRLAQHALVLGLIASLLFTALFATPLVYRAMGAQGAVLHEAGRYAGVLFAGAAAIWGVNVLAGVARGAGHMGAAALALLGTTALHLLLCPLLVFGAGPVPALGVAGAAASTVTTNAVAALALLAWLSRPGRRVRLLGVPWSLGREGFRPILRIALPSALNPLLSNGSIAFATAYVAGFGSLAIAGYGIAARLEYILVPVAFGVGSALTAMVATNLGAGPQALYGVVAASLALMGLTLAWATWRSHWGAAPR